MLGSPGRSSSFAPSSILARRRDGEAAPGTDDRPPARDLRSTARLAGKAVWFATNRGTAMARPLPEFVILGAQRAGTTSLFRYLCRHPAVLPPLFHKESHFFDLRYGRGLGWYRAEFPSVLARRRRRAAIGIEPITGEATPYYLFHPLAPGRVRACLPHVRVIALLRDPVSRAYSHYRHSVAWGFETLSFEDALRAEPDRLAGEADRIARDPSYRSFSHQHHSYAERGDYQPQLEAWLDIIPSDRMLILFSEDLFADPDATFRRVARFLGIPQRSLDRYERTNVGRSAPMPDAAREILEERFLEPNRRLRTFLGGPLPW